MALNVALTWRRQSQRRPAGASADPESFATAAIGGRSEAAILEEFLDSLNPADRSLLVLYMEGLPNGDIADISGLSAGAVAVRIHRMKQAFTERYVERG